MQPLEIKQTKNKFRHLREKRIVFSTLSSNHKIVFDSLNNLYKYKLLKGYSSWKMKQKYSQPG